jgi:hypothetical protein
MRIDPRIVCTRCDLDRIVHGGRSSDIGQRL